jgi:hypothetical protein
MVVRFSSTNHRWERVNVPITTVIIPELYTYYCYYIHTSKYTCVFTTYMIRMDKAMRSKVDWHTLIHKHIYSYSSYYYSLTNELYCINAANDVVNIHVHNPLT